MGKIQKKTGKGRLDKYYKLAKEQGYRARSAFKLIQLNKKFAFLETARCTIDLCAAPGGWLQVASKYMSTNSLIIGVDLVPIKPIPRVTTFAADITTPNCRNLIRNELKDWKADLVLHDGAPNVGTAWIQDAYSQSELVLTSLKLAVEFLIKGGTFVTKVFRSVDYNNLIWVFNQLFGKVEATKPPSSRNVSAEIFVVCRDFLAPKFIDPKFLDPRHVFKEINAKQTASDKMTISNNAIANVFQPTKKRRHRDGYADGDYILYRAVNATEFVEAADPISILGVANKIAFITEEEKEWFKMDITSADVKANCEDLKVLGKGDFKILLKWRLAVREELGLDNRTKETEELVENIELTEDVDEEQRISEELKRLNAEAATRAKRERRRANEIKARTLQRMQLQMTAPLDIGLEQQDLSLGGQDDMFNLSRAERSSQSKNGVEIFAGDDADLGEDSDEERQDIGDGDQDMDVDGETERRVSGLEVEIDELYNSYQARLRERDVKFKVKESRQKNAEREEWSGFDKSVADDETEDEEGGWDNMQTTRDEDEDEDDDNGTDDEQELACLVGVDKPPSTAQLWFSQDIFTEVDVEHDMSVDDHQSETDQHSVATEDEFEVVPQQGFASDTEMWTTEGQDYSNEAERKHLALVTPEAVTMAQRLVNRQITRTQLINDGFSRYSLNSNENLPHWFLDDEAKHYKPNLPVTKEAIKVLREKQRALDARPIKKIAEAKARKKLKAHQQAEKALKKAEGLNATSDLTEREKAQQIEKLMQKSSLSNQKRKKDIKIVVAKGVHKGIKGRPKGVKGRYTMVDARMKKELKAKKRTAHVAKKRKKA